MTVAGARKITDVPFSMIIKLFFQQHNVKKKNKTQNTKQLQNGFETHVENQVYMIHEYWGRSKNLRLRASAKPDAVDILTPL